MIKKLQRKFILLSMSAFLLVLVIIISSINIVNYNAVVQESDQLLSLLSKNKGEFPSEPGNMDNRLPPGMSPEIPYESRYFSVILDKETNYVVQVETSRIISVDTAEAINYAQTAISQKNPLGFIHNFRYSIESEDIFTRITFLDCGRRLDAFWNFMYVSIGISMIGYIVVFLLIAFFSNRIIRPISESYEKQKRFITDAGHEIKTPLTIIHADTDVLEMEIGQNEWIEDIQKQTKQLTELTNDLILLSRMEESENSMPMIDFPFSEVVNEAAISFHALAHTQEKAFRCDIEPMLTLHGNEKAIRQLVSILLDNALKYSPSNGVVSITVEQQNKTIRLTVYNTTNHFIPKENLKLLFDRFYRMDPSHNSQTGGHGIGLSLAKAIVSAHHGKIQASTHEGNDLQITVVFPA